MCGIVTDMVGSVFDNGAKKKNAQIQQGIFNNDIIQQRQNFDTRTADVADSDQKQLALDDAGFNADQTVNRNTYDYLLKNKGQAFDDQTGYANTLNTADTGAAGGLVTANRQVRLDQQALLDQERARQQGFQTQADTAGAGFAASSGQPTFDANRAADASSRDAFMAANTGAAPAQFSSDPAIQGAFAKQLATRVGQATTTAQNANAVAGYSDALNQGNEKITGFRQGIDQLDAKARMSEAPLASEFAVGDSQRNANTDVANFTTAQAGRQYAGDSARSGAYHTALGDAMSGFGTQAIGANDTYYNGRIGAEAAHIQSLVDASKAYQAALTNLANYKMGNTTSYSPIGMGLHALYRVGQATSQALSQTGGG